MALEVGMMVHFPTNIVYNRWAPSKVSFFAWEASWEKVMTLDHHCKRGQPLVNRCYPYKLNDESIDHLLLHCSKVRIIL